MHCWLIFAHLGITTSLLLILAHLWSPLGGRHEPSGGEIMLVLIIVVALLILKPPSVRPRPLPTDVATSALGPGRTTKSGTIPTERFQPPPAPPVQTRHTPCACTTGNALQRAGVQQQVQEGARHPCHGWSCRPKADPAAGGPDSRLGSTSPLLGRPLVDLTWKAF